MPDTTQNPTGSTADSMSMWDEVRRMADELELKVHLAGMDARKQWENLEPRLARLENVLARSGERVGDVIAKEVSAIRTLLHKLRADMTAD